MEVMKDSLVGRWLLTLWGFLEDWYETSALARGFRWLTDAWKRAWAHSGLVHFAARKGALSRGWGPSATCQVLTALINLPLVILRWIYYALRKVFDNSFFAQLGFAIAENTPVAAAWLMFGILVIPYEAWNNAYSLLGFGFLLCLTLVAGMHRENRCLDLKNMGPYVVGFALFVVLAWPLSAFPGLSSRFLLYHGACMLCVLVIVSTVERVDQLVRLAGMATAGLIVVSAYGIIQRIQGIEVNPSYVDLSLNKDMPGRVFSMFENPNAFGEVLVLLIPIAVAVMLCSRGWGGRFLGFFGTALGCASLIMTYSRAGWVGLAVAALLFVFLWKRKLIPLLLLVALAALPLLPHAVFNRILTIFNFSDTSTSSRFPLYEAGLHLVQLRPLQGAGLGSDAVREAVKELNLYHGDAPFVHCHNVYLQTWAETGFFGLLALIGSMGWVIKRAVQTVTGQLGNRQNRLMIIGGVSALLGILICGIADFIWHYPRVMLVFWFVVAITLAGVRLTLKQEERTRRRGKRSLRR